MKLALRFVTYLAPNQFPLHQFVCRYLGERLGCETELVVGSSYDEVFHFDLSFICGLPYVLRADSGRIEPLAAPVLQGERYQDRPIYFSDVIVRRDSSLRSFADLRGRKWAYNEPESQSGYGITRYCMAQSGLTHGFFGEVIAGNFHQEAIRMVCDGRIDAAAIDSHVLALELRDFPELATQLRVIDSLGPSTIQPLTVTESLPESLKDDIRDVLLSMHHNPDVKLRLTQDFVERFAPVTDADYDDIRRMLRVCQNADFLTLR